MGSTMDSVSNILGIDRVSMSGKIIAIEEQHGSNANFLLNTVIFNALKKNHGICLVLFHNTFGHYHNVGMKVGHNLTSLKDKGQIAVVEPMKDIASNVEHTCTDTPDTFDSILVEAVSTGNLKLIHKLFISVKNAFLELIKTNDEVVIIIDDLSHLCDLGFTLKDVMYYVRYLRSFLETQPTSQLCILTHTYDADLQICTPDTIASSLKHSAHLFITVKPLETGYSTDASGKMTINWRIDSIRKEYHWPETSVYLYKLMDRHVRVYAPGATGASI